MEGMGRPVHLSNGERRLLEGLLAREIEALEAAAPPAPPPPGPARQEDRNRLLRIRQYRRLARELHLARPESPEVWSAGFGRLVEVLRGVRGYLADHPAFGPGHREQLLEVVRNALAAAEEWG